MNAAVAFLLSTTLSLAQFRATPGPESDSSEQTSSPSLWYHNGSTMYLVAEGARREFYYQDPRPEMERAGAHQGSLLFTGRSVGGRYFGTAYIYNFRCGRTPYQVSGPILDKYDRVVLHGQAPLFGPNCEVRGHLADTLEFKLLKSGRVQSEVGVPAKPVHNMPDTTVKCEVNVQNESKGAKSDLYSFPGSKAITGTVRNRSFVYLSGEEKKFEGHSWVSVDVLIDAEKGFAEATVEASGWIDAKFLRSCSYYVGA
jgi:hypothetical protein